MPPRRTAERTALFYALVASLWILGSDRLLDFLDLTAEAASLAQTAKGWVFVAASAIFFYLALRAAIAGAAGEALSLRARVRPGVPLALIALLAATLAVVGSIGLFAARARALESARAGLAAVADLKAQAVGDWLTDRREELDELVTSPLILRRLARHLAGTPQAEDEEALRSRFDECRGWGGWRGLAVLAAGSEPLFESGEVVPEARQAPDADWLPAAVDGPWLVDPRAGGSPLLVFRRPLAVSPAGPALLLVGAVDAAPTLFERLRTPTAGLSAVSIRLLARQADHGVVIDGPERAAGATARRFDLADETDFRAVALREREKDLVGREPGGARVLAAARALPASDWVLLATLRQAAVVEPIEHLALWLSGVGLVLLAAAGAGLGLWWRGDRRALEAEQRMSLLEREREAAQALAQSEENARRLLAEANLALEARVEERTAELARVNRELEVVNRELDGFASSASHDLRAPLRRIDGFVRILAEDHATGLDAEGQRLLRVILDSAERMARLIDDLLRFARASRLPVEPAEIDMEALVDQVIDDLVPAERRSAVEIRRGPLPAPRGDPGLLRQVWHNLLSNALKFTATRERPTLEISASREGGRIHYRVQDNGVGFDPRLTTRLFGVFERLHSEREFEGTGVGLALVASIVARHGGGVGAEGRPGEGATFWFWLPAAPPGEAAAARRAASGQEGKSP